MNTIGDMQIEMDFFYHCNVFVYNLDFEQFFQKNVDELLVFVILDSQRIFIWVRLLYIFLLNLFIWLNTKPFPGATVIFLFNSYKPMLLSEIVKLTV